MMMQRARPFLMLTALALLIGCILVDQFGRAWDEAVVDPCLTKIAQSLYYAEYRRDPSNKNMDNLARGWTIEGQHFLLLKKEEADHGGRMYRFDVVPGRPSPIFDRYRLTPTMRDTFEKEHPDAPVSLKRDTVTVTTLDDEKVRTLLVEIAKDPRYWEVEDKILYNTMHNPTCHFDQGFPDPDPVDPQDHANLKKPRKQKP